MSRARTADGRELDEGSSLRAPSHGRSSLAKDVGQPRAEIGAELGEARFGVGVEDVGGEPALGVDEADEGRPRQIGVTFPAP
jgi:hypothetical protein